MGYELELDRAVEEIKKSKAKVVCLQLPDGLRPKANEIQRYLEEKTDATFLIWLGSCWGACDVPIYLDKYGIDLIIQWGHSPWRFKYWE